MLILLFLMPLVVSAKKPHILYVVMDDQGYGDIGYTQMTQDIKTPFLDSLAAEGMILNRHYSAWLCTPTRASIMSGKYPIDLGIQHDVFSTNTDECLNEKELLLPEVVRHNGYATHLVGKWHLGYARWSCMPCKRGFDSAYGYINGKTGYTDHIVGNYYDFYDCQTTKKDGFTWNILTQDAGIYSLYLYNRRVKQIIENHDPEQPLFLYLAMQSVHSSYYAPEKYYTCHDTKRCTMQAMLNAAEDLLQDTMGYFQKAGMWNNTLMVYHADNGAPHSDYTSNGFLNGYKSSLWEGGVRTVGFLYSVNETIQSAKGQTDCYVHVSDWYRTIITASGGWDAYVKITGLSPPTELDSIDQTGLLSDNSTCARDQIMLHIDPVKRVAGYFKGKYKLLIGDQDSTASCESSAFYPLDEGSIDFDIIQLFDIYADPYEESDISDDYPDIVKELKEDVIEYLSHQVPLQCQLPTVDGSYPNSKVPYYLPFDFRNFAPETVGRMFL